MYALNKGGVERLIEWSKVIFMTYYEYRKVITEALNDYCKTGGSLLNIALNDIMKEYIYEFDEPLPEDTKKNLVDKAHQAMHFGTDLPRGIQLVKVIFKN